MTPLDFLSIGHITRDLIEDYEQVGGSCLYSAKTALRLGLKAGIVTSAEEDYPPSELLSGIEVVKIESPVTTTFRHFYLPNGMRTHECLDIADPIDTKFVPQNWRQSRAVLITPNWWEVGPEMVESFDPKLLAVAPQGWFRTRDHKNMVSFGRARWDRLPKKVDLVVVSENDILNDPTAWEWLKKSARIAVRTRGKEGEVVSIEGVEYEMAPPVLAPEVDPTGAGDVFTGAMLIALLEGASPLEAADFGSVAASFSVEHPSFEGVPTREQVFWRLKSGQA